jgi:hypothetical protein
MTVQGVLKSASAEMMAEARGWLEDCFDDLPGDLSDAEVVKGVNRHYDGGWAGFARTWADFIA